MTTWAGSRGRYNQKAHYDAMLSEDEVNSLTAFNKFRLRDGVFSSPRHGGTKHAIENVLAAFGA